MYCNHLLLHIYHYGQDSFSSVAKNASNGDSKIRLDSDENRCLYTLFQSPADYCNHNFYLQPVTPVMPSE